MVARAPGRRRDGLQLNTHGDRCGMSHPWLAPPPALIADVVCAAARDAVRAMWWIPVRGLGRYAEAWTRLIAALPELLRSDSGTVFDAVTRVDVLSTVQELVDRDVDGPRLERAVLALWMALAGHRGLTAPLALPGPFRGRAVDAKTARLIELGDVRGAAAVAPPLHRAGVVIANGVQLEPADALARACGNAAALPWRADRSSAAYDLTLDLDDICAVAEPTASGAALLDVLRAVAGD